MKDAFISRPWGQCLRMEISKNTRSLSFLHWIHVHKPSTWLLTWSRATTRVRFVPWERDGHMTTVLRSFVTLFNSPSLISLIGTKDWSCMVLPRLLVCLRITWGNLGFLQRSKRADAPFVYAVAGKKDPVFVKYVNLKFLRGLVGLTKGSLSDSISIHSQIPQNPYSRFIWDVYAGGRDRECIWGECDEYIWVWGCDHFYPLYLTMTVRIIRLCRRLSRRFR